MRSLSPRRVAALASLFLVLVGTAALAPVSASAMTMGVEANGELANPGRTPADQAAALDRLQAQGATLIRLNVSWQQVAEGCAGQQLSALRDNTNACYDWSVYDSLVSLASARNIQLLFSVTRAPSWLQANKPATLLEKEKPYWVGATSADWTRTTQFYPAFITAIATRYNSASAIGTVKLWTIWSEPNSKTFWLPINSASPSRYAVLYSLSAQALKAANPAATVAPGPTGPNSTIKPVPYIKAFQKAIVKLLPGATIKAKQRFLGAWAHNPYPVIYAPTGNPRYMGHTFIDKNALGMAQTRDLIRLLDSAPITRGLKVWATEFGWETNPPDNTRNAISLARQAQYIPEAYDLLDATGRVTIGVQYLLSDPVDPTNIDFQSGTYFANGTPKPSFYAYQRMISTNVTRLKRGGAVIIFAKANTAPRKTAIMFSANGRTGWKVLSSPRRADGSIRRVLRMQKTMYFATWDGLKRGPSRAVVVSK